MCFFPRCHWLVGLVMLRPIDQNLVTPCFRVGHHTHMTEAKNALGSEKVSGCRQIIITQLCSVFFFFPFVLSCNKQAT